MKVSDKVSVLRELLERVRTNARGSGGSVPPSSGRVSWSAEAEASASSMRLAMRPPDDDRWDHAPAPIDEPIPLVSIDVPLPRSLSHERTPRPREPLADELPRVSFEEPPRDDDDGVLLDLDPTELPEVDLGPESIPPLSPPPSRLRAVESAPSDPEAMRFWLSALTTPKSSPPAAFGDETPEPSAIGADASRVAETAHAQASPSRSAPRTELESDNDPFPLAPRVPRWGERSTTAGAPSDREGGAAAAFASVRGDTSSPALVAPGSEHAGRITIGPRSRRRSMRFRPRAAARPASEGGSRWLRAAVLIAGGVAAGIIAFRLLNPRAIVTEAAADKAAVANVAPPNGAVAPASAPASAPPVAPTPSGSAGAQLPSSELSAAAAAPILAPEPLGLPVPSLPEDRGRLLVHSHARASVYVNGTRAGTTNAPFDLICGMRHVRLAKDGLPPPGKSFPMWTSEGVTVMVPCRAAFEIDLEPGD